ncbi:sugar transferase [Rhizobium laguerreae]
MGTILIALIVVVGGIFGSALSKILAEEFKAWRPNIVHRLVAVAASLLSDVDRDRYREEWSAYVEEIPGDLGKVFSAIGFVWAATRMSDRRFVALGAKRIMDVSIALTALLLFAPLLLIAAFAIKLESPGSVFFGHRRLGKDGREFRLYKFRSTHNRSEDQPVRLTRVGRVLRFHSWDELPQLLNVLKGDMSVVGPHPFSAVVVPLDDEAERILQVRQKVRPGLTGFGQLLRSKGQFENSLLPDLAYVAEHSITLDIGILAKTAIHVFNIRETNVAGVLCAVVALVLPVAIMAGFIAALLA